ncbi:DUF979 domain-containing protein [Kutzneria viridogrisea]|uniref:Membrane protein n=1 Tax=Kutzneria viridogrisea TaxID=47990 RepID=A0ABR6BNU0_9PSEU|nr:putative membrane protein [Kutzneria viridogrisea]
MIDAEWLYWLCGLFFLANAVLCGRERRYGAVAFWALLGLSFCYSTFVVAKTAAAWPLGLAVLVIAGLAGFGAVRKAELPAPTEAEQESSAAKLGNRLFVPALMIPLVALVFATMLASITVGGKPLLAAGTATLTGLGAGALIAVAVGLVLVRPAQPVGLGAPLREGSRLLQSIGWVVLLPQMLAVLGLLFDKSGVGKQVGTVLSGLLPGGSLLAAVVVYCVGMALFTVVMGNAFAAFPVMTAAVGWPVLIQQFHGNPALVFAVGMLAGFCGTLCTPMAANFNIVPAVLLEMKDRYGPIKAQLPTAIPLLACNIAIMYWLGF